MSAWILKAQDGAAPSDSFVGGPPNLPAEAPAPACDLCGAAQTFFFQLAFPAPHPWAGHSLAVFACTACADEQHFIPEMLTVPLAGAEVPAGFLEQYQKNFRLLAFPSKDAVPRPDIEARVERVPLVFEPGHPGEEWSGFGWVGGSPAWLLDDEAPSRYEGAGDLHFLFQLTPELTFPRAEGAPRQVTLGLDGKPRVSSQDGYRLFLGNAIYFFGVAPGNSAVYVLTQID